MSSTVETSAVATTTAHLDQDALNNLTPEERKAFDSDEYTDAERASMQRLAGGAEDDDDDGDPDEVLDADGKPVVDPESAAGKAAAADAGADAAAASKDAPATDAVKVDDAAAAKPAAVADPVAPKVVVQPASYQAELPADYDDRMKSVADRTTDLRAKFKAGEIDLDGFLEQNAELDTERQDLTLARSKVEISKEMTTQNAAAMWTNTINSFYDNVKGSDGVDYRTDATRQADLDHFVKALANNPANEAQSMEWFLTEAHKRVNALHGTTAPAVKAAPAAETKPAPAAPAVRTPPAAPRGLSQIPGGEGPGDVGSEFAHLDALDGDALEAGIARMTPAQREKYARGG